MKILPRSDLFYVEIDKFVMHCQGILNYCYVIKPSFSENSEN